MDGLQYFYWYSALAVLLLILLALNVSRLRISHQVANGDGGHIGLKKAIRAHGNAVEHLLPFGLAILALSFIEIKPENLAALVFGFLGVRLLHAYSLLSATFNLRRVAALTTDLFELLVCGLILANLA